jgi:hypothetical protein
VYLCAHAQTASWRVREEILTVIASGSELGFAKVIPSKVKLNLKGNFYIMRNWRTELCCTDVCLAVSIMFGAKKALKLILG